MVRYRVTSDRDAGPDHFELSPLQVSRVRSDQAEYPHIKRYNKPTHYIVTSLTLVARYLV